MVYEICKEFLYKVHNSRRQSSCKYLKIRQNLLFSALWLKFKKVIPEYFLNNLSQNGQIYFHNYSFLL
jgi:hypothetical protein